MSGMINSAPNAGQPGADGPMSDPVLQAAEMKIEAALTPANRQNYMKIVVAGMAAGMANGPKSILASLLKSPDPVRDAAKGAVALVLILRRQARGVMPLKAMVPAAMTLMLRALDFVNRAGKAQVGTPELVRATHIFTNELFGHFGITPPMLANAVQRVHAITADPVAMDAINRKAGTVRDPNASEVTQVPGGPQ
jgi:hypothetical protein